MKISTLVLGELGTNCYLVDCGSGNAVAVDPASSPEEILRSLEGKGLALKKILLTHAHFDHMMAASRLMEATGASLFVHELDAPKLTDTALNLWDAFASQIEEDQFQPVSEYTALKEGDVVEQDGVEFQVIHTPGHTSGSVSYLCGDSLFTGDCLFTGSIGRTDFPDGSYADMMDSLEKLKNLDGDYTVYPGHNRATTLEFERENNIYLCGIDQI